jgi:hypothetical protein
MFLRASACFCVLSCSWGTGTCGNGLVEDNEQCDCGSTAAGACDGVDDCCDPATCRLKTGSSYQCSNNQPCCSQCKIRTSASAYVCRAAVHSVCDTAETCDGTSAACPTDKYQSAGVSCTDSLNTRGTRGLQALMHVHATARTGAHLRGRFSLPRHRIEIPYSDCVAA